MGGGDACARSHSMQLAEPQESLLGLTGQELPQQVGVRAWGGGAECPGAGRLGAREGRGKHGGRESTSQCLQSKEEMELGLGWGQRKLSGSWKQKRESHWQTHLWTHRELLRYHQPPAPLPAPNLLSGHSRPPNQPNLPPGNLRRVAVHGAEPPHSPSPA